MTFDKALKALLKGDGIARKSFPAIASISRHQWTQYILLIKMDIGWSNPSLICRPIGR